MVALNRLARRSARPLVRLAVVAWLALALAATHGAVASTHMSGAMSAHVQHGAPPAPGPVDVDAVLAMCLAVMPTAALLLAVAAFLAFGWRHAAPLAHALAPPRHPIGPCAPRSRAGPEQRALLQVFRW